MFDAPAPKYATHVHYPDCAAMAEIVLRERKANDPEAVARGVFTQDQADERERLAAALAAQWRWIVDPAAPALPEQGDVGRFGAWNCELAAEMATLAQRARDQATKRRGDPIAANRADICETMAWFQVGDAGDARVVRKVEFVRSCNRALRARRDADQSRRAAA